MASDDETSGSVGNTFYLTADVVVIRGEDQQVGFGTCTDFRTQIYVMRNLGSDDVDSGAIVADELVASASTARNRIAAD